MSCKWKQIKTPYSHYIKSPPQRLSFLSENISLILLFLGHRSFIKNKAQTAVINILKRNKFNMFITARFVSYFWSSENIFYISRHNWRAQSTCPVRLGIRHSKPQICRTNVRWPALICGLVKGIVFVVCSYQCMCFKISILTSARLYMIFAALKWNSSTLCNNVGWGNKFPRLKCYM